MQDASTTEAYQNGCKGGYSRQLAASIGLCGDVVKPVGVSQFAESRLFIIKNTNSGKHFNNKEAAPWP